MIKTIKKTKTNLDLFSKMKEEKLINIKDFQFLKQGPNTTANEIYLLESCTINNCSFLKKNIGFFTSAVFQGLNIPYVSESLNVPLNVLLS